MRFPSQAQKKHGNSVYKQKILILFSRGCHHKPKKTTEIPFSKRRYWHYFPRGSHHMPKKRKSRFQIEDIGIIIPNSQNKIGRHHFQIEDIVKQPMGKRKRPFQIEDIHYTNPKFSEQDCATNHFFNRRYSVG